MAQEEARGHDHGHGHHHEQTQLDRIERSVGRQEAAHQRNEKRMIEALERLERLQAAMATLDEQLKTLKDNLDAATTKLGGDLDTLIAAFKATGSITPAQQALLDQASGIADKLNDLDAKTVAATAQEPPIVVP